MKLTKGQEGVMEADGDLLIIGGPGSGKTTISILKAAQIAERDIRAGQKVLFLSFARATVSRVVEAIEFEQKIPAAQKRLINVETYHSFFWRVLKAHGYLAGLPRRLSILTSPSEAIALSNLRSSFPARKVSEVQRIAKKTAEEAERARLANVEGRVCFDYFAPVVGELLHASDRLRRLVATMYPVIILDEFQDTNEAQWGAVRELGKHCRLIALADPEQRIYDWIGANPARLDQYRQEFKPADFDLSTDNHRSAGTDIALFGNDLLTGKFRQATYRGVAIDVFEPFSAPAMSKLITTIYGARKRLVEAKLGSWSLAILVPTKKMTSMVSDALRQPPAKMAAVTHTAVIEREAAILGAEIIGLLMQPANDDGRLELFVDLLCNFYQGKGGDEPTQGALREAAGIRKAYAEAMVLRDAGKELRKKSVLVNILDVYSQASALEFTGDPDKDWRAVRAALENGACSRLKEIANEVRGLRILERGMQLRQALSQDWRDNGVYLSALSIVRSALVREHFSTNAKPESGVIVMNMHKAKGKQFDEVIIFEGWPVKRKGQPPYNADRIVRFNALHQIDSQARQNLRVSVTRGKRQTTILTPRTDRCVLLIRDKP